MNYVVDANITFSESHSCLYGNARFGIVVCTNETSNDTESRFKLRLKMKETKTFMLTEQVSLNFHDAFNKFPIETDAHPDDNYICHMTMLQKIETKLHIEYLDG